MSSLESHTMVPTLTMFGRVSEWTLLDSKRAAVADEVTTALLPYSAHRFAAGFARVADVRHVVGHRYDRPAVIG
jgi:hypothetical protein